MKRFTILLAGSAIPAFLLILIQAQTVSADTRIRCASTTSTQNSGLFDHLLPLFEKKSGIKVHVIAVGTGAAIEIGKRGDVDLVFVHAREQELKAVEEGYFLHRHNVMYNDFVIIGPRNDPAKIKGMKSATDAFRKLAESGSFFFVSRGDRSGTHTKELSLWKRTGIEPAGRKWYLDAGQGMEKTQRIADEKRAYTLTDRGTWLSTRDREKLDMVVVLEGDPELFNQYGIMIPNPVKHRHVKSKAALELVNWIISKEGQEAIAGFTDRNGHALFIPNAE